MKIRCYYKKHSNYEYYGGRGITVCEEWKNNFKAFYDHVIALSDYGKPGYTIDRIKNDKNYEPGNVRWASKHIQSVNRRICKKNESGYLGVTFKKRSRKWESCIIIYKEYIYLGLHETPLKAVKARNEYILSNGLTEYKIQ